jgi:hypothetical protein
LLPVGRRGFRASGRAGGLRSGHGYRKQDDNRAGQ